MVSSCDSCKTVPSRPFLNLTFIVSQARVQSARLGDTRVGWRRGLEPRPRCESCQGPRCQKCQAETPKVSRGWRGS